MSNPKFREEAVLPDFLRIPEHLRRRNDLIPHDRVLLNTITYEPYLGNYVFYQLRSFFESRRPFLPPSLLEDLIDRKIEINYFYFVSLFWCLTQDKMSLSHFIICGVVLTFFWSKRLVYHPPFNLILYSILID